MLSITGTPDRTGSAKFSRRELLRIGALSTIPLTTQQLNQARAEAPPRANACVFLFLFGGPSHIDLWDMKPDAPAEIRGEFKPIATNVAGIQVCEHLPKLAAQMDKVCLLRSMCHQMPVHGPACSEIYSGRPYFGPPLTDEARPEDWPSLAALVAKFHPTTGPLPTSVVLPWFTQFAGQSKRIAGQTGGRMGDQFRPMLVPGDPSHSAFRLASLNPSSGVSLDRMQSRKSLLEQIDRMPTYAIPSLDAIQKHSRQAIEMLEDRRVAQAFNLQSEPKPLRDRYGDTRFGQSLLLARRLLEAGVSLITVNWDDETRDDKVSPFWDTHNHNFSALRDRLCPVFDCAYSAFLADLADRGLLDTTLVVAIGEFGRTPKIGQVVQNGMTEPTGRDHWPHAFTALLAGGGVRGGQTFGKTTSNGGYVVEQPVSPADMAATILEHLGVDPNQLYFDNFQRIYQRLSVGKPIRNLG